MGASDGVVELRQDDGSGDKSIDLEFNANGPSIFVPIPGGGVDYGGVCHAVLTIFNESPFRGYLLPRFFGVFE